MGYKTPPRDKRFKPGQSGNPKGRPKALPELRVLMEDVVGDDGMREIFEKLYKLAQKGNIKAAEILIDRGYGKAKQTIDVNDISETQTFIIGGQKIEF